MGSQAKTKKGIMDCWKKIAIGFPYLWSIDKHIIGGELMLLNMLPQQ